MRLSLFRLLCLVVVLIRTDGIKTLQCVTQRQFFATYGQLRDSLGHFTGLYEGYARSRPKVVAEHIKAFQLRALAQDFLELVDEFRFFVCLSLCPEACVQTGVISTDLLGKVRLAEALNNIQLDIELLTSESGLEFRAPAQMMLREAKQYAVNLLANVLSAGPASGVDWDEAVAIFVSQIASRVVYPVMQVVAISAKRNESETILNAVSLDKADPASESVSYIFPAGPSATVGASFIGSGQPPTNLGELAVGMLHSLANGASDTRLSMGPTGLRAICKVSSSPYLAQRVDAGGFSWPRRAKGSGGKNVLLQMLEHIEASVLDLSHSFLVMRPLWPKPKLSCSGSELEYDPTLCLEERGWGGYIYNINVHPPFKAEMNVLGRNLGESSQIGQNVWMNVLNPYNQESQDRTFSVDHLLRKMDIMFRQSDEPSPDVFFLHPATHNCHALEYLFGGSAFKPKLLIIPINPLIPPPFELMPRFDAWLHHARPVLRTSRWGARWVDHEDEGDDEENGTNRTEYETDNKRWLDDEYAKTSIFLSQCSLASVEAILRGMAAKRFAYRLHHVEQSLAVFARQDLQKLFASRDKGTKSQPASSEGTSFRLWLEGWLCVPDSRYYSQLEMNLGADVDALADPSVPHARKTDILCRFTDDHHIPVQRKSFDCDHFKKADVSDTAGKSSCVRSDTRGWGNDPAVSDSVQVSARACENHCGSSFNCVYWTYDPTMTYGQPLCWIWQGSGPGEIKSQIGWTSGDVECGREMRNMLLHSSGGGGKEVQATGTADQIQEQGGEHTSEDGSANVVSAEQRQDYFREWAVQLQPELPGSRYFLESSGRGRCFQGLCECFPPFRGALCEQSEPGKLDGVRNFTAALHYLTSDGATDIEDIRHSLHRLWIRYNCRFDYPVVVFNDGLSIAHRQEIVQASPNRIWFAYVDDYLDVPEMMINDPSTHSRLSEVKWSLGYRGMCRFRSGTIFTQPVLRKFQYAMTLDTDGYMPADVKSDPIEEMHAGQYIYTFSHVLTDSPGAVRHFWDYSLMYMKMKGIHPLGTSILRDFVREEDVRWNYQLYMNDIEIVQLDWFRSDPYQDYFRYLDSVGGFWLHRWGDHAMRTIAVGMWLPREKVHEMHIPYGHQNYCKCGDADTDLECVKEGDHGGVPEKWWTCVPAASE